MEFFAEVFSKYWFVFCLIVLVAGTAASATPPTRRTIVARVLMIAAGAMIVLGLIGFVLG